jgi:hypothetical protein
MSDSDVFWIGVGIFVLFLFWLVWKIPVGIETKTTVTIITGPIEKPAAPEAPSAEGKA